MKKKMDGFVGYIKQKIKHRQEISFKFLIIISLLLFVAVMELPYGYYTFMRIIVCSSASFMCFKQFKNEKKNTWFWIWAVIAILFNPIFSIHLDKEIWMAIDAITGLIFAYAAYKDYQSRM